MISRPAQSVMLQDIPEAAQALSQARQKQFKTRENSLLNLTYDICGFTIRTMTIQDYVLLDRFSSPFLYRIEPDLDDIALFLWVLSPQFSKWLGRKRLAFLQPMAAAIYGRKIRKAFGENMPFTSEPAVVAIFEYIDTMFFDSPPTLVNGQDSCLSYLTGWFCDMQSEFGFTDEKIWSMGLPELFQRSAYVRQRYAPSAPTFNKATDEVKLNLLRRLRSGELKLN